MQYQIYDFVLESNIALPELIDARQETEAAWKFCIHSNQQRKPLAEDWLRHIKDANGSVYLSVAMHAGGYLLRFPGLADFSTSVGGTEIECYPQDGIELGAVHSVSADKPDTRDRAHAARLSDPQPPSHAVPNTTTPLTNPHKLPDFPGAIST